jgi:hypothetical protein
MFYILVTIKCVSFNVESRITELNAITPISDSFYLVVLTCYLGSTTEIRFFFQWMGCQQNENIICFWGCQSWTHWFEKAYLTLEIVKQDKCRKYSGSCKLLFPAY